MAMELKAVSSSIVALKQEQDRCVYVIRYTLYVIRYTYLYPLKPFKVGVLSSNLQ